MTPAGNSPKASPTLSSSSSTVSWVALNLNDFSVSLLAKVTLRGTAETSDKLAPPSYVPVSGTTTWRLGSALSCTFTVTEAPSATE